LNTVSTGAILPTKILFKPEKLHRKLTASDYSVSVTESISAFMHIAVSYAAIEPLQQGEI
jgi:hypothetical protein